MTLRDEIARAGARAVDRTLDGERAMTPPQLGDWHPLVTDATDDILAKVREALLSDEAIVAAQRGITSYVWDPENQEEIIHRKMLGATRSGIKEALDSLA